MLEKSPSWNRFKSGADRKIIRVQLGHVPEYEESTREERFSRRAAVVISVALYIVLLVAHLPEVDAKPRAVGSERPVYVVQQLRFTPPPAAQQQQIPKPREKRKVIPVPDLTPDEPEPLQTLEIELPDFTKHEVAGDFYGIPDAPPQQGPTGPAPLRIGGDIQPPKKTFYPSPGYTEDARQAQIQGVVILEAIVDEDGAVQDIRVLKGLPKGLSESAIETAKTWRFEPATQRGVPVPVIFNLTISFSLQ